jgi:opacity protein-like surface antigen
MVTSHNLDAIRVRTNGRLVMSYRSLLLAATLCVAIGSAAQAAGLCPSCGNASTGVFSGVNFQYWAAHYSIGNGNDSSLLSRSEYPSSPILHKFGNGVTPPHGAFNPGRGARMGR